MKTTNHAFTWKRGLCAAVASLLLLTGCSSQTPAAETSFAPGAAAGGNNFVTTEAPIVADTPEDIHIPEAASLETTEPAAAEAVKPNACGQHLTWTITDYGTLVIEGSGAMYDYDESENRAPWYERRGEIRDLQLPNELTTLGSYAFCDCTELQYGHAFSPKNGINHGITAIGQSAFQGCSNMKLLVCPENLTSIAASTFSGCTALREVWILNKDCKLDAKLDAPAELTICGFPGSTAEQYAKQQGYAFNPIVDNHDAIVELIKQDPGYSVEVEGETRYFNQTLHYNGLVSVGEKFVSQIQRSEHVTATEEEIKQAEQSGTIEVLGTKYEFTTSEEQAKEWKVGSYDWDSDGAAAWMRSSDNEIYLVLREGDGYAFRAMWFHNGDGYLSRFAPIGWLLLDANSPADRSGMPCTLTEFFYYGCYPKIGEAVQQLELNGNGELALLWASAGKK